MMDTGISELIEQYADGNAGTVAVDRYNRLRADFDNYRKRSEAELVAARSEAEDELLLDVIEVADSIDAGLEHAQQDDAVPPAYLEGMQLIRSQVTRLLRKRGVERVESIGCRFDPSYHECVGRDTNSDFAEDVVSHEIRSGYTRDGKMLRPAQVLVSKEDETTNCMRL